MAVFGGAKFPTGKSDVINWRSSRWSHPRRRARDRYDGMAGMAYSRFLTSQLTVDASAQGTDPTEANGFRLGDRFDAGVAMAYRFIEDVQRYPQVSAFAEANVRYLQKSEDGR